MIWQDSSNPGMILWERWDRKEEIRNQEKQLNPSAEQWSVNEFLWEDEFSASAANRGSYITAVGRAQRHSASSLLNRAQ